MKLQLSTLLLFLSSAETVANRIDFSGFSNGEWVTNVGQGTTVTVVADPGVGCFGPNGNEPMIFDSEVPSDVDYDLNTPHKDFGGPGKGNGGKAGAPGENAVPLGNLIIMSEDCNQEIPNDDIFGGVFTFSFDEPKNLKSVGTIDFNKGIVIEASFGSGAPDSSFSFPGYPKNGVLEAIVNLQDVVELRVKTKDSGGIAFLEFFDPDPIDPVGAYGDPHFKMWDGSIYEFHGACDLVLLDNPDWMGGHGMTVHLRTKTRSDFSYISNVVVKMGNETFEVAAGNEPGFAIVWVNGVPRLPRLVPETFHGFPVFRRLKVSDGVLHVFTIKMEAENAIVIKSFPDFTDIRFRSSDSRERLFEKSRGLLGNLDGEMVGRDGSIFTDTTEFAEHWQVKPSEPVLFYNGVPGPLTCAYPSRRHLRQTTMREVSEMDAASACAGLEDEATCISDVLSVGDLGFASHFE